MSWLMGAPRDERCARLRRRMWSLLQLHARGCQAVDCPVPRCRELREMRRRQIVRQEEQRRQGYQNMLRNQVAGGTSSRATSGSLGPQHDSPSGARPAY